jgi:single-strand DNA-binding protein
MAGYLNRVMLIGNLGSDPESRVMSNGNKVVNVSLATTETWKDKQGQKHQETEWHRVVAFSPLAEIFESYLKKGSSIFVSGKNKTRKWQNKDGVDMYTTEVHVREMQMLDSKGQTQTQQNHTQSQQNFTGQEPMHNIPPQGGGGVDDSDIPF